MFMELYREEKREEGDRGGQEDKRGESKGERQNQPVISSLSSLPNYVNLCVFQTGTDYWLDLSLSF